MQIEANAGWWLRLFFGHESVDGLEHHPDMLLVLGQRLADLTGCLPDLIPGWTKVDTPP